MDNFDTIDLRFTFRFAFLRKYPWLHVSWKSPFKTLPWDWKILYGFLFLLIAIELGYLLPEDFTFRRWLGFLWLGITALFLSSVLVTMVRSFFERDLWSSGEWAWYMTAVIAPLGVALIGINGVTWMRADREGWLQISIADDMLHNDPSLGVYRSGYGPPLYPVRQFLLAYVPTALFGPSLLSARLGYYEYLAFCYLAFVTALAAYLRANRRFQPWIVAGAVGCCVGLATYTQWWVRYFEQSMTPVCVTMFLLAGMLKLVEKPTPYRLFWVAWALGFLPYCHRPTMAVIPMALVCLASLGVYRKYRSGGLFFILVYGILATLVGALVVAPSGQGWDQILKPNELTLHERLWRGFQQVTLYVGPGIQVIPTPLMLAIILVGLESLRRRDLRFFVVVGWALCCLAIATVLMGLAFHRDPAYDMIRTLPTVPFLATAVAVFYGGMQVVPRFARIGVAIAARATIIYMIIMGIIGVMCFRMPPDGYAGYPSDFDREILCIDHSLKSGHTLKRIYIPPEIDDEDGTGLVSYLKYMHSDTVIVHDYPPANEKIEGYYVLHCSWTLNQRHSFYGTITIHPE